MAGGLSILDLGRVVQVALRYRFIDDPTQQTSKCLLFAEGIL